MDENRTVNESVSEENINELIKIRQDKLQALRDAGQDPFSLTKYSVSHHSSDIKDNFDDLEGKSVSVAGRMMSKRIMGKASFCNVQDLSGMMQVYICRHL